MGASDIRLDAKRTRAEISDDMLAHAARFIEDGDLVQASEKIWGALSRGVRQAADRRGWPLAENRDQKAVGAYISQRLGDDALDSDMGSLWEFHVNFYEDNENAATLEKGLEKARDACAKLKAADGELAIDLPAPNGPLFREYQRRWENKGYPAVKPVEYTPDELRAYYTRTLRQREKASDCGSARPRSLEAAQHSRPLALESAVRLKVGSRECGNLLENRHSRASGIPPPSGEALEDAPPRPRH